MGFDYDEKDMKILRLLSENSRLSFRQLASKAGLHPNTVISRIKRMEEAGVIEKYTLKMNYRKLDYLVRAVIQVDIHGQVGAAARKIAKLPGIREVYRTTGEYDVFATAVCRQVEDLNTLINAIGSMPEVQRTNTKIVLETFDSNPEF